MAGAKVRGITIDLGVDASGVASGLKSVNSSLNSTSRELKDIDRLLKLDPSNVTLLAQKHEALQRQITQTSEKLELLKKAEEQVQSEMKDGGTEEQQKQLAALQREIISTENNLEKYTNQLNSAESETRQLAQAEEQAGDATGQMKEGFTVLKGALANLVAQGISKAVDGFKEMMTAAPQFADQILTLSSKTGLATDTLQELSYMSGLVDVDVSTVAGSLKKLTKNMDSARDGTGSAAEAFKTLGISVTDINGNLRDNEDVFFDAIDALGKMENETERDAVAMSLFGKSATDLNPMIEAGSDALRGFAQEAHDMGYVLDGDALDALGNVQDEFDRFGKQMESVKIQIASGVAPAIERAMKKLSDVVKKIDWKKVGEQMGKAFDKLIDALDWLVQNGNIVKSILTGIVTAMAVNKVVSFVSAIGSMTTALKTATTAQKGLNAAANANPYILLATAIIGVTTALVSYGKGLLEANYNASLHVQRTKEMNAATDELIGTMQAQQEEYNSLQQARDQSVNGNLAELAHVQSLSDELKTLTDENGKVADSDKARADFILNELNGALGTEYSMTGNVIGQYSELSSSVDQLIQKKQALIILEAQEDAYKEALQNQAVAQETLAQYEQQRIGYLDQMAVNQQRINELNDYIENSGQYNGAFVTELANLTTAQDELRTKMEETDAEYQAQQDLVDQYAYNIQAYTDNMTAGLEGDYDKIAYKSWDMAKMTGEASNSASQQVIQNAQAGSRGWLTSLGDMVTAASGKKTEFQDVGNGMVQAYVDGQKIGEELPAKEVKVMAEKMHTQAASISKDMSTSGYNAVAGFANSVDMNSFMATNAGRNLASEFLAAFRAKMDEGSPSKEMAKSGLFAVLGFTNEIEDNYKTVAGVGVGMADAFLNTFNKTMDYNAMLSANAGMPSASASGSPSTVYGGTNNVTLNIYGAEGQNVNALADEVIDKLQRTIQGSEAVYA